MIWGNVKYIDHYKMCIRDSLEDDEVDRAEVEVQ